MKNKPLKPQFIKAYKDECNQMMILLMIKEY